MACTPGNNFVIAGKTLDLSIFDNFGAQLQAPVDYHNLFQKSLFISNFRPLHQMAENLK